MNDAPDTRTYWTDVGRDKVFTTPFDAPLFRAHVPTDAAVLDYGCGYGRTLDRLADEGYANLTGIDFSPTHVERGKQEHPGLNLLAYPGGPLPFDDHAFHAAVMLGVLTCIPKTADQAAVLLELRRVLKPGGLLYVNDFLINRDNRNLDRYRLGQEKYGLYGIFDIPNGGVMRHHDRAHMEALFSDFEIVAFEEKTFETMHGHESAGFTALVKMPA